MQKPQTSLAKAVLCNFPALVAPSMWQLFKEYCESQMILPVEIDFERGIEILKETYLKKKQCVHTEIEDIRWHVQGKNVLRTSVVVLQIQTKSKKLRFVNYDRGRNVLLQIDHRNECNHAADFVHSELPTNPTGGSGFCRQSSDGGKHDKQTTNKQKVWHSSQHPGNRDNIKPTMLDL